jgi:erythromycin esterase
MRYYATIAGASVFLMAAAAPPLILNRATAIELAFGPQSGADAVITLSQGQSADVIVTQRGVDVVVAVRAPDGTLLDEVDSPNGRNGDEPVFIYARTAGRYRLRVTPISGSEPLGRVAIRVATVRTAAQTSELRRQRAQLRRDAAGWIRQFDAALPPLDQLAAARSIAPFDRLAQDARVMGLGEATHGSREFNDVRLRLLQRMVERHGYRAIAVEDSVSRWRALEPYVAGTATTASTALEWGWIGRRTRRELLEWVRAWNLSHPGDRVRIVGVDPQDNSLARAALGPLLRRAYGDTTAKAWGEHEAELAAADKQTRVFGDSTVDARTTTFMHILVARLTHDAPLLKRTLGPAMFEEALDYSRELSAFADFNSSGSPLTRSRDLYMAVGVLRALEAAGGAKAAYWGHNSHIAAPTGSTGPTGALLRSALGCGYRAVASTFGKGSFLAQIPNDPKDRLHVTTVPLASEDTVESVLAEVRPGTHLAAWNCGSNADNGASWLQKPQPMRWVGGLYAPATALSGSFRPSRLMDAFDAVVYFPVVRAESDPGDQPVIPARVR